jgi:hypothetical protein
MSSTSFKAFTFGLATSLALLAGVHQRADEAQARQQVVKLETVVVHGKRQVAQQLPTVYVTARRADQQAQPGLQLAALSRASCNAPQVC